MFTGLKSADFQQKQRPSKPNTLLIRKNTRILTKIQIFFSYRWLNLAIFIYICATIAYMKKVMKKIKYLMLLGVALCLSMVFVSCIAKEEPNTECDIEQVIVPDDILAGAIFISNNEVSIPVKAGVDYTRLAPDFVLTEGATIVPAGGTERDFTEPQIYTVTSQDGQWHKEYLVSVKPPQVSAVQYNFEEIITVKPVAGKGTYDVFIQTDAVGNETFRWASANQSFALTGQGSTPDTYPTYQGQEGYNGKCVVLQTLSTGSFGAMAKKPIAAGNLFFGNFDAAIAMSKPLAATHFGIPFYKEPISLQGFYKYIPGAVFQRLNAAGKLEPSPGETDTFTLYMVMYETSKDVQWLDGSNVTAEDNPLIIGLAQFTDADRVATSEWKEFNIPFVIRAGKTIDPVRLANGEYNLAIVLSSSAEGDTFCGAIGSTLMVDELAIICKNKESQESE